MKILVTGGVGLAITLHIMSNATDSLMNTRKNDVF